MRTIVACVATQPSPALTYYEGNVTVVVDDDADSDEILRAAVRRLRQTSFPDRGLSCWRLVGTGEGR